MALTKNMSYDHPAYTAVHVFGGANAAGANAIQSRFAAVADMIVKSFTATVITQGTGASNATLTLVKILGTTTSSLTPICTMGTVVAGFSTNVLCTASLVSAGEILFVQGGADATGVWATGIEYLVKPGASVTP